MNHTLWITSVGGVVAMLVKLDKDHKLDVLWGRFPKGYRWVPAVILAALAGAIKVITEGATDLPTILASAADTGIAGGLAALGVNAGLTESKIPWNGGAGGK